MVRRRGSVFFSNCFLFLFSVCFLPVFASFRSAACFFSRSALIYVSVLVSGFRSWFFGFFGETTG
ncbi:hypothetical protein BZA05DRAFT_407563 [Tricharina praecox]|uniref:uncharacterized protein n=1 Tax=Tricharina praecox TaxID=43433 RepID=UPI002220E344|nr:uncharacterized protein BZA05DRAFT_407563 [Tricharina praecox]KAI5845985.1 hypothetical protein BZA05DRAFT_407563 [Tricharina praecox]